MAVNPSDIRALQKTVGNRAVQRLMDGRTLPSAAATGLVQRHTPASAHSAGLDSGENLMETGMEVGSNAAGIGELSNTVQELATSLMDNSHNATQAGFGIWDAMDAAKNHPCDQELGDETQVPATGGV